MRRRIYVIRLLSFLLALLLIATPAQTAGPAYAKSQKAKIRSTLNTFFKAAKKINKKKMKKCFVRKGSLFRDDERFYQMLRPYTNKIRWKVKRIKINKKQAIAYVTVRYPSLYEKYWDVLLESAEDSLTGADALQINKNYIMNLLERAFSKNEYSMIRTRIKVRMQKVRKKWKIAEMKNNIMNVVYCGYVNAMNDFMGVN